ncbi:prepilin-type N-terminal cleavage/methylation domain-containing protein [Thiohalobacter sp. IOR34]|uniref:type IV pilus modification PilV family protein n=1 Tax=Thiohalobacter sp. IOR34 TaxID=3057176 RepID=UPI0025B0B94C|nr:prepilin-type N-terminal cleavage/methylation domain-containing protein [Thiohalobacter sp. IOR34]WJW75088.1 prepilin-type N-terminal cleavage/methylation domain-containing protein [Thiohalobacter sp. IOR34]
MTARHPARSGSCRMAGFTLIEALLAMALLAVGLVGAARFQALALRSGAEARARTEALALAQRQIETLRGFTRHGRFLTQPTSGRRQLQGVHRRYRLSWRSTPMPDPELRRVEVRVDWRGPGGGNELRLITLIAGHDPQRSAWRLQQDPIFK